MLSLHCPLMLLPILLLYGQGCHAEKIINGSTVPNKAMQYMASVQNNGKHVCGGFVIRPNFVLTAAHCNEGFTGKVSVVLGAHNINKAEKKQRYYIKSKQNIYIHEEYKEDIIGNDIMLLKLSGKINKGVQTVKIPSSVKTKTKKSTKCLVAGWGDGTSALLQVVQVQVVNCPATWIQNRTKEELPENVICAKGFNRSSPSKGDSGGPLVCNGLAVGIVSSNLIESHQQINSTVYTQISKFLPWIKAKIGPSFSMQESYF